MTPMWMTDSFIHYCIHCTPIRTPCYLQWFIIVVEMRQANAYGHGAVLAGIGKGGGSGSVLKIDGSRQSPGFSQDRCSVRIRSRNWARTLIFCTWSLIDACFVEFSSWVYTSESLL